jgi:stress-induced-phosphoprotein 1
MDQIFNFSAELKNLAKEQFKLKNFEKAIELYTTAIDQKDPDDLGSLYANRSACYYQVKKWPEAFRDAKKCTELEAYWFRGY